MRFRYRGRVLAVLFAGFVLLVTGGCGGGGDNGNGVIQWTVTSVNPDTSTDLTGGDRVTITGTKFLAVQVATVRFGATPGTNLAILNETTLEITTPPAPGGVAQTVAIEVVSINAFSKILFNAYTYVGVSGPPQPATITPTTYTATGMESFFIDGTNLGPPNGTVTVTFAGVGAVTGNVNATSTIVTGNAPISPGQPPAGSLVVTVTNGAESGDVPTQVSFDWDPPAPLAVPGQAPSPGGAIPAPATRPVRLADGYAVMCTAGADGVWGTALDDIFLIAGPPAATISVTPIGGAGSPVGFLDPDNSVPAVMDGNTFCVYSVGPNGTPADGDEDIIQITAAQTSPVVTKHRIAFLNTAPIAAAGPNRIAFTHEGPDTTPLTSDDTLIVWVFTGTTPAPVPAQVGYLDNTPGPGNLSIPVPAGVSDVYVVSVGPNTVPGDADDRILRLNALAQVHSNPGAAFLAGRPLALSPTMVAAPAGIGIAPGTANDQLLVFNDTGTAINRTVRPLGAPVQMAALVPYTRIGGLGIAVALQGVNSVALYTNPQTSNPVLLQTPQIPLLATLGTLDLLVFDPGPLAGLGDERLQRVLGSATGSTFFSFVPGWNQGVTAATDTDRGYGIGLGGDGTYGTGDEWLLVHQTLALGDVNQFSVLPMGHPTEGPVSGTLPFVPVGPGWGLMQSPGASGVWGDGADRVLLVRY